MRCKTLSHIIILLQVNHPNAHRHIINGDLSIAINRISPLTHNGRNLQIRCYEFTSTPVKKEVGLQIVTSVVD